MIGVLEHKAPWFKGRGKELEVGKGDQFLKVPEALDRSESRDDVGRESVEHKHRKYEAG